MNLHLPVEQTTIFEEMSLLARQHDAINLGQGFPDRDGPAEIRQAAADAIMAGPNQYPPMRGLPLLREAVATHYAQHQGLGITAENVLITSGATEALAASILSLIEPGDKVVMIEPMYDAYLPLVRQAGGVPHFITLRPPEWRLDAETLDRVIDPTTKAIVFNNPLNPAGRAFTREELSLLADVCIRNDVIVISDEVWEHIVFDGRTHVPLHGLPGMAERTIKIGSAGKIFSLTGWKVGFAIAPPPLLAAMTRMHQYLTFSTPPALQIGTAHGLTMSPSYFTGMREGFARSRDTLAKSLAAEGLSVLPSEGTYFLCIDLSASGIDMDDRSFCLKMVQEAGVAMIPLSPFYASQKEDRIVRLCFAKADELLIEAALRLGQSIMRLS
ncbi:aminotransferase [Pacificimonas sp. ICDLI1SI03]